MLVDSDLCQIDENWVAVPSKNSEDILASSDEDTKTVNRRVRWPTKKWTFSVDRLDLS